MDHGPIPCLVLQENEAKKARALKKIEDEQELTDLKDREIERYIAYVWCGSQDRSQTFLLGVLPFSPPFPSLPIHNPARTSAVSFPSGVRGGANALWGHFEVRKRFW